MQTDRIIALMKMILGRQGKPTDGLETRTTLRELGFRSLDFSELCLRAEEETGRELNFDAGSLRRIETVGDVCQFLSDALK